MENDNFEYVPSRSGTELLVNIKDKMNRIESRFDELTLLIKNLVSFTPTIRRNQRCEQDASNGTVILKKLHEQDVVITIEKCLQENKLLEFAKLHKITGIIDDIRFLIVLRKFYYFRFKINMNL